MKRYRVVISIRARGQAPFDQMEKRSEDFDEIEEFAESVKQFVLDNIFDDIEADEGGLDDEADFTGSIPLAI